MKMRKGREIHCTCYNRISNPCLHLFREEIWSLEKGLPEDLEDEIEVTNIVCLLLHQVTKEFIVAE